MGSRQAGLGKGNDVAFREWLMYWALMRLRESGAA